MRIFYSARGRRLAGVAAATLITLAGLSYYAAKADDPARHGPSVALRVANPNALELSDAQLGMINVGEVTQRPFPLERKAVGSVDFNQDMVAQVFPPFQGRIVRVYAKIGDNVTRGKVLYAVESPDLIQANSALIAAAGVLDLTTHALNRARQLYEAQGMSEKDLQQAISDQQTAEGALKAARDAVAVYGKSPSDIDRMVRTRTIDPYLVVTSPITGRVTSRNAAVGDFVQPGTLPAPYSVADINLVWLNANVTESDMPSVRQGQAVHVSVMAFPGREFTGEISTVGPAVDPQLHRGLVRAEIEDPKHELLPGMFASFVIVTGAPVVSLAVPMEGVVRQGDGNASVWLTRDRHHFIRQIVKLGQEHDGYEQIKEGVHAGDGVVTKGAIFLDNLASGDS
jgi:cobalt-zinc-cadmium efflux system membrane fusion protein